MANYCRAGIKSLRGTEGKTPHERDGKGRAHMRETSRRRITEIQREKLPMRVKGNIEEEEKNGYVVFKYRGKSSPRTPREGREREGAHMR